MAMALTHLEFMVASTTIWVPFNIDQIVILLMPSSIYMMKKLPLPFALHPIQVLIPILSGTSSNTVNPFVPLYKQAYHIMQEAPPDLQPNIRVSIVLQPGDDHRRYNLPTVNEVAAILPGSGEEDVNYNRDIVLRFTHGGLRHISHLNPLYHPLHYVLLFPNGDQGYHSRIQTAGSEDDTGRSKHVTQRCYFAFRLHPRPMEPSDLFRGGKLFQQYIVDAWASVEDSELHWVRLNQTTIRADLYDNEGGSGSRYETNGQAHPLPRHSPRKHTSHVSVVSGLNGHRQTLWKTRHLSYHDRKSKLARDPRQFVHI